MLVVYQCRWFFKGLWQVGYANSWVDFLHGSYHEKEGYHAVNC